MDRRDTGCCRMRILNVGPSEKTAFDCSIIFEADWLHHGIENEEFDISSVCYWVSNTFAKNFVILEYLHKCIAGGCTDNAKAWNDGYNNDYNGAIDKWELRCSEKDASIFLLKYKNKE